METDISSIQYEKCNYMHQNKIKKGKKNKLPTNLWSSSNPTNFQKKKKKSKWKEKGKDNTWTDQQITKAEKKESKSSIPFSLSYSMLYKSKYATNQSNSYIYIYIYIKEEDHGPITRVEFESNIFKWGN